MDEKEIVEFLTTNIEPLKNRREGNRYRVAAYLTDGTFLPCVVFQSKRRWVDQALKSFEEERERPDGYRSVVESFVTGRSSIPAYYIRSVERSPFAWPKETLQMIHGETTMGWTAFVVEMNDGKCFSYGTGFLMEFFDLPDGYSYDDIKVIHSGMIHSDTEGTVPYTHELDQQTTYLRERKYFTCYIDGIDT